jgi:antitoxin component YwqK of YwqJK toxin-antitoxin module
MKLMNTMHLRVWTIGLICMMILTGALSCQSGQEPGAEDKKSDDPEMVKRFRDDGTLSSINPVDNDGYVHGVKVNYYEDGKSVHSKVTYEHGRKHGPAIWYYKTGEIYEHTGFLYGKKDGLTKRYYQSGELMEEMTYKAGEELPGKKKFDRDGTLITE